MSFCRERVLSVTTEGALQTVPATHPSPWLESCCRKETGSFDPENATSPSSWLSISCRVDATERKDHWRILRLKKKKREEVNPRQRAGELVRRQVQRRATTKADFSVLVQTIRATRGKNAVSPAHFVPTAPPRLCAAHRWGRGSPSLIPAPWMGPSGMCWLVVTVFRSVETSGEWHQSKHGHSLKLRT